ncbi:hypothetical protein OnM2_090044, partial [Erysiphe neolycopersici]
TYVICDTITPQISVNISPSISISSTPTTTTFPSISSKQLSPNRKFQSFKYSHYDFPESIQSFKSSIITLDMLSASENEVPFEPWMENASRMMRRNRSILLTQLPSIMDLSRKPTNSVGTKLNCFSTHMCSNQPRPKLEAALPDYSSNKFPTTRRPKARILSDVPLEEINKWFEKVGTKIGTAVGDENQRNKVKRLLFTYSDLNGIELKELVPTDLYVHRVRLKEGTNPSLKLSKSDGLLGKKLGCRKLLMRV